jgi:hypothetical protein
MKPVHTSNILVCGTARNVAPKLKPFLSVMDKCLSGFRAVDYLICESFSSDDTKSVLSDIASMRHDFNFFTDLEVPENESRRTVRIASARNQLLSYVKVYGAKYDFIIMADLDGVNRDLRRHSIESCWAISDWDMVSASQPLKYYDIWALRAKGWVESDWWEEFKRLSATISKKRAYRITLTSKMRSIRRSSEPIAVESAFGGLAIYTREAFISGSYRGTDSTGKEICEHVPFHNDLITKGYKLYINPRLVNLNEISQLGNLLKELIINARSKR